MSSSNAKNELFPIINFKMGIELMRSFPKDKKDQCVNGLNNNKLIIKQIKISQIQHLDLYLKRS